VTAAAAATLGVTGRREFQRKQELQQVQGRANTSTKSSKLESSRSFGGDVSVGSRNGWREWWWQ
jgi:hypothetical protein